MAKKAGAGVGTPWSVWVGEVLIMIMVKAMTMIDGDGHTPLETKVRRYDIQT